MGLFSKDKKMKFALIPSTPEQTQARSYLNNLYQQDIQYPTEQIADLTPSEQTIQGQLPSIIAGMEQNYGLAENYYKDVLSGKYDPMTSAYYQGVRGTAETQKQMAQSAVLRQGQGVGANRSTPTYALAAQTGQNYDNAALQTLGQLQLAERNNQANAAQGIQNVQSNRVTGLSQVEQLAQVARQNQQMKMSAAYNAAIQTMLAPYTYNAQIASALLNEQRYVGYQTGGGLQEWAQGLMFASSVAGAFMNPAGGVSAMSGGGAQVAGAGNVQSLGSNTSTDFSWSGMGY